MLLNSLKRTVRSLIGKERGIHPAILMYHRVATPKSDPWSIAVAPNDFLLHMSYLRRYRRPMPLPELVEEAIKGKVPNNAVAVTFDDGYADNLVTAKPILETFGIPATLFLATGSIGQPEEFWWDELAKLFLELKATTLFSVTVSGRDYEWKLEADGSFSSRQVTLKAHFEAWKLLRDLTTSERARAMDQLRQQAGPVERLPLDRAMTESEIKLWLNGKLTSIAGHTVNHPPLRNLKNEELLREIHGSLERCEQVMPGAGDGFAYPYGDCDDNVARAVQDAGAKWACTTESSPLKSGLALDRYRLPRLHCRNGDLADQLVGM